MKQIRQVAGVWTAFVAAQASVVEMLSSAGVGRLHSTCCSTWQKSMTR